MTDFDVRSHRETVFRYIFRRGEFLPLIAGIVFLLIAIYATVLYVATGTKSELIAVGIISVSSTGMFAAWAANRYRDGQLISVVKIDPDSLTFVPVRGSPVRQAWADPKFDLNLGDFQHPERRPGPANAGYLERYFIYKDARQQRLWGSLSQEAFVAILQSARQNGLTIQQALTDPGEWYETLVYFVRGKDAPPPPIDFKATRST